MNNKKLILVGGKYELHRLVVLRNEKSTRARQFKHTIDKLQHSKIPIEYKFLQTTGDSQSDIKLLIDNLVAGDVLAVWGGDGTGNYAARALVSDELIDLKIPLLYLWGGNGIDKARQTNGHLSKRSPSEVLLNGRIKAINPMFVRFTADTVTERLATAYVGFGNMAELTRQFNDENYRAQLFHQYAPVRLAREAQMVAAHLSKMEDFTIEDSLGQRTLHELIISNGSRIAKFGRFMSKLNEPRVFKTELQKPADKKNNAQIVVWATRLVTAKSVGDYIYRGDSYEFTLKTPTKYHLDGEYDVLPAGTKVEVGQDKRSLYVITTKL